VRFYFIWECVEDRKVDIEYVDAEKQITDFLMKLLSHVHFFELRVKLDAIKISKKFQV
jgi:hypothetical protein